MAHNIEKEGNCPLQQKTTVTESYIKEEGVKKSTEPGLVQACTTDCAVHYTQHLQDLVSSEDVSCSFTL